MDGYNSWLDHGGMATGKNRSAMVIIGNGGDKSLNCGGSLRSTSHVELKPSNASMQFCAEIILCFGHWIRSHGYITGEL